MSSGVKGPMMHDHDLDLIAEYASGLLSKESVARAQTLVDSCTDCAHEYASQQHIRTLLASDPAPSLTEFERMRMRRNVLQGVAPSPSGVTAWQRRWMAIAGAAAAVLVVVGGVGVLGGLSGGDSDGDLFTLAESGDGATERRAGESLLVPPSDEDTEAVAATASDESVESMADASVGGMGGGLLWLVDAGVIDRVALDGLLDELVSVGRDEKSTVTVEDAIQFGAACASTVEADIVAVLLATVDGTRYEIFVTGEPANPDVITLTAVGCNPADL